MSALAFFAYLLAAFVAANLVSLFAAMFRSLENQDTSRSWRFTTAVFVAIAAGPYLWAEVLTKKNGAEFKVAVTDTMHEADIDGKLAYYRIMSYSPKSAHLIVVVNEATGIGFNEHLVMTIEMAKNKGNWASQSYKIVSSFKRSKDSVTMPPYW